MALWGGGAARSREFEEVALPHLDAIYRTALHLTHNRAEAEDLAQETYFKAFRSFDRFNPGTDCRAWLFTILRNTFLNRVRDRGRELLESDMALPEGGLERLADHGPSRDNPEEELLQTVLHGDVERALRSLPAAFREAVVLADLEGLTYREVAQVLGCPIGTVMSRLSRGRSLLRQALGHLSRARGPAEESR